MSILVVPGRAVAQPSRATKPSGGSKPTLRFGMPDASLTVDPALVADEQNSQFVSLLYRGLVRLDASYRVVKDAASRYTVSRDRRTYTFYVRPGLKFSNGDPLTAKDFEYSIQRSLTPALKSPSAPTYLLDIRGAYQYLSGKAKSISGLHVRGNTLRITTRWPSPYFLMELTYPTSYALDAKRLKKLGYAGTTNWYSNPISSGPFKLRSWSTDGKVVLVPNKRYVGPTPAVGMIRISVGSLPYSSEYQYISHSADIMAIPNYDPTLLGSTGIRQAKMLAIDGIYMSLTRKPFNNRHVRRALTLALHRSLLVTATMKGSGTPFAGSVPVGEAGYDPHLRALTYNPGAAARELTVGGYADRKRFPSTTLYYAAGDPAQTALAQAIVSSWHKHLHISVSTQALTVNTLFTKIQSNRLPLYLFGWSADYPDPHDWLSLQWETGALDNNVRYRNSQFDKIVQKADATWRPRLRMSLYNQAQQILVDDAAWIPLYIPHRLVYVRPTVQNLSVTGYGLIPRSGNWAEVRVHKRTTKKRRGS